MGTVPLVNNIYYSLCNTFVLINYNTLGTSQTLYEKVEDNLSTQKVFFNELSLEECDEENDQESAEDGIEGDCDEVS